MQQAPESHSGSWSWRPKAILVPGADARKPFWSLELVRSTGPPGAGPSGARLGSSVSAFKSADHYRVRQGWSENLFDGFGDRKVAFSVTSIKEVGYCTVMCVFSD